MDHIPYFSWGKIFVVFVVGGNNYLVFYPRMKPAVLAPNHENIIHEIQYC